MRLDAGVKTVVVLAGLVIVVGGLRESGAVFLPILAGLFIAVISMPFLKWLEEVRVPRPLAIALTVLLDVAVLAGLAALIGSSLSGFNEATPRYRAALGTLVSDTTALLRDMGVPVEAEDMRVLRDAGSVMTIVGEIFDSLTAVISNTVLVSLLVVFMLFEIRPGGAKLKILLGGPHANLEPLTIAAAQVQRYLVVKTGLSVVTGALCGGWMAVCGLDFPLLWGLLTFLLNYIPSVGAAVAGVPPVLIALLTLGPGAALAVAVGYLSINFFIGNAIEPRLMGTTLGLSTLVVFLSMLFWGWVWGPVGALFAVPLTMLLRSALELSAETRWLAVLLGSSEWVERKRREWGWTTIEERQSLVPSTPPPPATTRPDDKDREAAE